MAMDRSEVARVSRSRSPRRPSHEPSRIPKNPDFSRQKLAQRHVVPSTALWSPEELAGPFPLSRLEHDRETVLTTSRGTRIIIRDSWMQEGAVQVGYGP